MLQIVHSSCSTEDLSHPSRPSSDSSSPTLRRRLLICGILVGLLVGISNAQPGREGDAGESSQTPAEARPRWTGEPITLSLRDADLAETLRNFAKIGDFNLVLDPGISGKVNVELRDVPWDQALDQILKAHGLGTDVVGGRRLIASPLVLAQQRQQLTSVQEVQLRLRFASSRAVADLLRRPRNSMLTDRGTAIPGDGNTLVIRDRAYRLQRLGPLLQQLDRRGAESQSTDELDRRAQELWQSSTPPSAN